MTNFSILVIFLLSIARDIVSSAFLSGGIKLVQFEKDTNDTGLFNFEEFGHQFYQIKICFSMIFFKLSLNVVNLLYLPDTNWMMAESSVEKPLVW